MVEKTAMGYYLIMGAFVNIDFFDFLLGKRPRSLAVVLARNKHVVYGY